MQPQAKGAGLVMKLAVDGSSGPEAHGREGRNSAYEQHVRFCHYLATRSIHLDLWDGDALLQVGGRVGGCTLTLRSLF